jgi:signal transduction histidine kinase
MTHHARLLPLWLWLALALAALAGIPPLAYWGASTAFDAWQQHVTQSQIAAVRRVIGSDVARWRDSAWQRGARAAFAELGVDVVLVDRDGLAYATDEALLLQRQTPAVRQKFRLDLAPASSPAVDVIPIRPLGPAGSGTDATGTANGAAYLWIARSPPAWVGPLAGLAALLLTLAIVAWLLLRLVLRPLAAMRRAARQIAGGEWDIRLPASQAREVAEVSAALTGMSTALQEALSRQTALEEERRLFIGAIAHDLRTPLFALRGYLRGLESGVADTPERVAHYVQACSVRADALDRLIAELFAYTRVEFLDQQPQREPLELGALLAASVETARPAATVKGVVLAMDGSPTPCAFAGDRALLDRAVQNLLDNAVRHTPPGGCVRVRWTQNDRQLVFQVEDAGPGIAPHDLPHLFTPLYRGEPSRNRHTGGAGLGLTIARRILRAHGGDLVAANGTAGGALFTGTLPLAHPIVPAPDPVVAEACSDQRG